MVSATKDKCFAALFFIFLSFVWNITAENHNGIDLTISVELLPVDREKCDGSVWSNNGHRHGISKRSQEITVSQLDDKDDENDKEGLNASKEDEATSVKDYCAEESSFVDHYHSMKAIIVDLRSEATLSCHYCGESIRQKHVGMLWYKFARVRDESTGNIMWRPDELKLDTHDFDKFNRVFTRIDHTLVIRDFRPEDVGTYICEPTESGPPKHLAFTSEHVDSASASSMALAWQKMAPKATHTFLYHVDLALTTKSKLVSNDSSDFPKPAAPLVAEDGNWEALTQWEPWGKCSVCGPAGERRRQGRCMVKRRDASRPVKPYFLDPILRMYPEGAPCHSTLFFNVAEITARSSELEVGQCKKKCSFAEGLFSSHAANISQFIFIKDKEVKKPVEPKIKIVKLVVRHKQNLTLNCPKGKLGGKESPVMVPVVWYNVTQNGTVMLSSEHIQNNTNGRLSIGVMGELNFTGVDLMDDKRNFSCWVFGEKKAEFIITVDPKSIKVDVWPYVQMLVISYGVNLVLFIFTVLLKYTRSTRQIGKKRREK